MHQRRHRLIPCGAAVATEATSRADEGDKSCPAKDGVADMREQ